MTSPGRHLTDEWEPTDEHLWGRLLELARGDVSELRISGGTIEAPNHGQGFHPWPNPNGSGWVVKQYNDLGGKWKRRASLIPCLHGESVVLPAGQCPSELSGLVLAGTDSQGNTIWGLTPQARRTVIAGVRDEFRSRMEDLFEDFDQAKAAELGKWVEMTFRTTTSRTPPGGAELKKKLSLLVWELKNSSMRTDPNESLNNLKRDWGILEPQLGKLTKLFSEEGSGRVIPPELVLGSHTYINEVGLIDKELDKYAKRLETVIKSLTGWRKKALDGLVVVFKRPDAFNGTVSGKYKRDKDQLWLRTSPVILRRDSGYAGFEYILLHELGHRYERFHSLPDDFERSSWYTTEYSRESGESFAELFALGAAKLTGSWDQSVVERFETVMRGSEVEESTVTASIAVEAAEGVGAELKRRVEQIIKDFNVQEALELGNWIEATFRLTVSRTPPGARKIKVTLTSLVNELRNGPKRLIDPARPNRVLELLSRYWRELEPELPKIVRLFSEEGSGKVIPTDVVENGHTYINEVGLPEPELKKYITKLETAMKVLTGWRQKVLKGLVLVLKRPDSFKGRDAGLYVHANDQIWIRASSAILHRGGGYSSFEYILVHELGHRFERWHGVGINFGTPEWHSTEYSKKSPRESFAELFALGAFGMKGSWDQSIVERFEALMSGNGGVDIEHTRDLALARGLRRVLADRSGDADWLRVSPEKLVTYLYKTGDDPIPTAESIEWIESDSLQPSNFLDD